MNQSEPHLLKSAHVREWLRTLDESQWWPADRLLAWQMSRFSALLAHAAATSRFYRRRLSTTRVGPKHPLTPERVRDLPILTRSDIQDAGDRLNSTNLPKAHGWTDAVRTSGSTGKPITVRTSQWAQTIWAAFSMRDHLWHNRDFSLRHAAIAYFPTSPKARTPEGNSEPDWGSLVTFMRKTGPSFYMDSIVPVDKQLDWLRRIRPGYLMTYPTNLAALAALSLERGETLDSLVHARTKGETLGPDQRALAREAWGVEVCDTYSAQEVGYMALQAPGAEHSLVQSEAVYLEVLDEAGEPCAPGEIGRVVVTPLHNFATPLIRYEVGDYAEVGPPAPCGRGLPVLTRIVGRVRNMLIKPDGSRIWPEIGSDSMGGVVPVRQLQIVQTELRRIEARIVPRQPFTFEQQLALTAHLTKKLGKEFRIVIRYVDEIERSPTGKYEDFRSEVASGS